VHESQEEADKALAKAEESAKKGDKFVIEIRQGERTRCKNYCQVSPFCNQYQEYMSTME
jgi:hypothetical protein